MKRQSKLFAVKSDDIKQQIDKVGSSNDNKKLINLDNRIKMKEKIIQELNRSNEFL